MRDAEQEIGLEALAERLRVMAAGPLRRVVALAGAPGSGKSHVAEALAAAVPGSAVLPMDGYHLDDGLLAARGDLARKGAPWTFDLDGFAEMLDRLRRDSGRPVLVPVFDRALEIARAGAREIAAETRLILAEGNYLLLDDPGWCDLAPRFDLAVRIEVPEAVLRTRLAERWAGLGAAAAAEKLEANDLPNMAAVLARSRPADLVLRNG
ncbi:nucleoside/nucleotide kinase family protein [Roseivivax sp. CAU 1761]